MIFPLIARLVLGGLLKIGVGESVAGRITSSGAFPIGLVLIGGLLAWWGVPKIIALHDQRIEVAATKVERARCVSEFALAAEKARADWLEHAVSVARATLAKRESDTALQADRANRAEAELKELRDASQSRDNLAVPPGDPWLRGGVR